MNGEFLDRWTNLTQASWKPFVELAEIGSRVAERATRQQLTLLGDCLNAGLEQFQHAAAAKDLNELLEDQAKLASTYSDKLLAHARQGLHDYLETTGTLNQWFENGLQSLNSLNYADLFKKAA